MAGKANYRYSYAFACRACHPKGGWHFGSSDESFEDARREACGGNTDTCPKKHPLPKRHGPWDEEYKADVVMCPHCGGKHLSGGVSSATEASAMHSLEFKLNKCKGAGTVRK